MFSANRRRHRRARAPTIRSAACATSRKKCGSARSKISTNCTRRPSCAISNSTRSPNTRADLADRLYDKTCNRENRFFSCDTFIRSISRRRRRRRSVARRLLLGAIDQSRRLVDCLRRLLGRRRQRVRGAHGRGRGVDALARRPDARRQRRLVAVLKIEFCDGRRPRAALAVFVARFLR